jgi:hypothetical protein
MAIIGLKPGAVIPYVPLSERGDEKNPCTVYIKYVSNPQVRDYAVRVTAATRHSKTPESAVEKGLDVQRQQFIENVVKVENYSVDGAPVTTAEQLYDSGDQALIKEIIQAMESIALLTAGQRKNFSGPSDTASSS